MNTTDQKLEILSNQYNCTKKYDKEKGSVLLNIIKVITIFGLTNFH